MKITKVEKVRQPSIYVTIEDSDTEYVLFGSQWYRVYNESLESEYILENKLDKALKEYYGDYSDD